MKINKVYIDSNILIQQGKPPGGPLLKRIGDLAESEKIQVLTTDLTIQEVAKHHAKRDYELSKAYSSDRVREILNSALDTSLPDISSQELYEIILKQYMESVGEMMSGLDATVLEIDSVKPTEVFDDYANNRGLFSGAAKKNQFPDAFISKALQQEATADSPVTIVSADKDFDSVVEENKIQKVGKLEHVFASLGLTSSTPKFVEFGKYLQNTLPDHISSELENWGFIIIDVSLSSFEVTNLKSFGAISSGAPVLVTGDMVLSIEIWYQHPDWDGAIYDSEDKVLIPIESINGKMEHQSSAKFSLLMSLVGNEKPKDILEFGFKNFSGEELELYPDEYQ